MKSLHYSYRVARACDIALTAQLPLEIHSRGWDDMGQREGIVAFQRGAHVWMNEPYRHSGLFGPSVCVAIGRFADGPCDYVASSADCDRASGRMYDREFTAAASELLDRAKQRLPMDGRQCETVKVMARAVSALSPYGSVLPEHVAEALSYRRPESLNV